MPSFVKILILSFTVLSERKHHIRHSKIKESRIEIRRKRKLIFNCEKIRKPNRITDSIFRCLLILNNDIHSSIIEKYSPGYFDLVHRSSDFQRFLLYSVCFYFEYSSQIFFCFIRYLEREYSSLSRRYELYIVSIHETPLNTLIVQDILYGIIHKPKKIQITDKQICSTV